MGQRHLQCTEQMEENSRWLPENRNWALPAIRRIMSHFLGRSLYSCTVRNPALILGPEQVALPVCMSVQNLIFSMLFPYTSSGISYFSGIGLGTRGQHQNRAFLFSPVVCSCASCAHKEAGEGPHRSCCTIQAVPLRQGLSLPKPGAHCWSV